MELPTSVSVGVLPILYMMHLEKKSDGSHRMSGIEGKFISVVLEALGIPFKVVTPNDKSHGVPGPNNSWTGLIGLVQRGEADIAMTALVASEKHMDAVDLSKPYHFTNIRFAMRIPNPEPVVNAFQYTFTGALWISVFCMFLLYPLVYTMITDKKSSYSKSFFHFIKCFLGQSFLLERSSLRDRILMGTWLVFATIISFSYCEVLMSMKAIPPEGKVYRNFKELAEAVKKGKLRCYVTHPARQTLSRYTHQSYIYELFEIINRNQWFIKRSAEAYVKVINEGHAMIASTNFLGYPFGEELYLSEEALNHVYTIIAISKTFCCRERLNQIISRLTHAGIHSLFIKEQDFKMQFKFQSITPESEAVRPIRFKEIYGVFILLLGGYFLSALVLLIEIIVSRSHRFSL